ncbi:hypothetical protein BSLG_001677 [Batrachochytrium salamandrivorans]|nr:hypothetical protein BSLG_001677 [Batrachochytrium salamandrivorans]
MTRRSSSLSSTIAAITFAVLVVARSAQGAPAPEESNSSAGKSGPVLDLGALGLGSPIMIPEGYRLPQSSPAQSAPGSAATSAPSQPPPAPSQPPAPSLHLSTTACSIFATTSATTRFSAITRSIPTITTRFCTSATTRLYAIISTISTITTTTTTTTIARFYACSISTITSITRFYACSSFPQKEEDASSWRSE